MTKVLITGAAGFIGHHIVEHILKNTDWEIYIIDRLSYSGDLNRLADIDIWEKERYRVKFIYHDLKSPIPVSIMRMLEGVDYVLHEAANTHVDRSLVDAKPFVLDNIFGTVNLLDCFREIGCKKIIIQGTDEIFGAAPKGYFYKENDRYAPSNPYAASKVGQWMMAYSYAHAFGMPILHAIMMNACIPEYEMLEVLIDGVPQRKTAKEIYEYLNNGNNIYCLSINNKYKTEYKKIIYARKTRKKEFVTIHTRYGRTIEVSSDHPMLVWDGHKFIIKEAREIEIGDKIPLYAHIDSNNNDSKIDKIDLLKIVNEKKKKRLKVVYDENYFDKECLKSITADLIYSRKIKRKGRPASTSYWLYRNWVKRYKLIPVSILEEYNINIPETAKVTLRYSYNTLPRFIRLDEDFLWLLGLILAEGCTNEYKKSSFMCSFVSDYKNIEKASSILNKLCIKHRKDWIENKPTIIIHNELFYEILKYFSLNRKSKNKIIDPKIKCLPNHLLKWFLQGYWDGDGQTGNTNKEYNWVCFSTSSKNLVYDLIYVLARFGIVASVSTTYHKVKKDSNQKYISYDVQGFCKYSREPKDWDGNVGRKNAPYIKKNYINNIILATVKNKQISKREVDSYDFTVEENHNFTLGSGIIVHNCGERQHPEKFIPKTVKAVIDGRKIVLHGKNKHDVSSRCWIHARDIADALLFLLEKGKPKESYNVVGPEYTVYELADKIFKIIKGRSISEDDIEWVDYHSARPGHDLRYALDGSKIKKIGWKPRLPFDVTFEKCIRWMADPKNSRWLEG